MNDNELLLFDRLEKIKQVINQYGEDNFYLSFSGGKDEKSPIIIKESPDSIQLLMTIRS